MAGLIIGAVSLISTSRQVFSTSKQMLKGAHGLTVNIQRLLQLEKIELSESDMRRLSVLDKRVACLVPSLNFLLLWSKKRDSCVKQAVRRAQELLFEVCSYVDRFVLQDGGVAITPGRGVMNGNASGSFDPEMLEHYLQELQFACVSLSMAVRISQVIDAQQSLQAAPSVQGPRCDDESPVSPSALLRASRRIQELRGRSGDLCACPGRLYSSSDDQEEWTTVLSLATFKVVAQEDARRGRRKMHGVTVDSRIPLSQRESSLSRSKGAIGDDDEQSNNSGSLSFPIEVALDARLVTTPNMSLREESSRCLRGVGVDSVALVWNTIPSASDASCMVELCDGEYILLPESRPETQTLQWPSLGLSLRTPAPSARSSASSPGRFAFVFDSMGMAAAVRAEAALTPLDALYLARLCAMDDGLPSVQGSGCLDGGIGRCPPHLLSSDEVLAAVLQEGAPCKVDSAGCAKSKLQNGYGPSGLVGVGEACTTTTVVTSAE